LASADAVPLVRLTKDCRTRHAKCASGNSSDVQDTGLRKDSYPSLLLEITSLFRKKYSLLYEAGNSIRNSCGSELSVIGNCF
jgi:hypothetical protein